MTDHTPEPLTFRHEPGGVLTGPDADLAEAQDCEPFALSQIFIEDTGYHITFDPRVPGVETRALADAERIVAAYNACAGIPTEQLGDVKAAISAALRLSDYYQKSVNVGPGPKPQAEALLWSALNTALGPFRED